MNSARKTETMMEIQLYYFRPMIRLCRENIQLICRTALLVSYSRVEVCSVHLYFWIDDNCSGFDDLYL